MNPWRAVLSWSQDHARATDYLFASALTAGSLVGLFVADVAASERDPDALAVALIVVGTFPLAWRRFRPLTVLVVIAAATFPFWVLDYGTAFDPGLIVGFYSATAHANNRPTAWRVVGAILAVATALAVIGSVFVPGEELPLVAILFIPVALSSAAILGEVIYQRRLRFEQLEQRARDLEAEMETKAKLAALDERSRIAREMHDVVAHSMSAVVVQAAAAKRLVRSDANRAAEALDNIETIGRESLTEMRRMLGVLRRSDNGVELAPQPSLSDYRTLVDHTIEAGVPVTVTVDGSPHGLSPGVELAAYRVVQEALTNIVKHAGRPVKAELSISYSPDRVEVRVKDNGLGAATTASDDGTCHGLMGMRERVDLYHGSLTVGPRDGGGYGVTATLPTSENGERSVAQPSPAELADSGT